MTKEKQEQLSAADSIKILESWLEVIKLNESIILNADKICITRYSNDGNKIQCLFPEEVKAIHKETREKIIGLLTLKLEAQRADYANL